MTKQTYHFILNENAGSGKAGKTFAALLPYLEQHEIPYTLHKTARKKDAGDLAAQLEKSGAAAVIVVGGDGTVHEAVNGFSSLQNITLGIIPGGTGNDFAAPLGIPEHPIAAFQQILTGETRTVDVMDIAGVRTVCFATTGLDIPLVTACNKLKKKKKSSYLRKLLLELIRNKTYGVRVTANGETKEFAAHIAGFTNTGVIASGMRICPAANVDDGVLDLVVIEKMPFLKLPAFIKSLYKGNALESPHVKHIRCTKAEIALLNGDTVNLDGELYAGHPLRAQVLPEKLTLFAPPTHSAQK